MKADFSFYTDDFFLKLKNECLVSPPASLSEQFLQLCLFFWAFCFFLVLQTWRPGTGQGSGLLFRWHHTVADNTLALHQTARRFLHYSLLQCSMSDYWLNWLMQLDQLITCDNRWWYYQSQYLVGRLGEACHKQVLKWKICANGIVFSFLFSSCWGRWFW